MISYRFVPISSQKGVLFLRHPVVISLRESGTSMGNNSPCLELRD